LACLPGLSGDQNGNTHMQETVVHMLKKIRK